MSFSFYKYQGTGNDFIMIDNRSHDHHLERSTIEALCKRKTGIGADGLILLEHSTVADFKMVYFNADGRESSMCGNGGRCIGHFASFLHIVKDAGRFEAIDGIHDFELLDDEMVKLKMNDVASIITDGDALIMDTGSPHYVKFDDDIAEVDVVEEAQGIRYNDTFRKEGINVNFVEVAKNQCFMRTYERGVEDETLSCGTGTVAVALSVVYKDIFSTSPITINTLGGQLKVHFRKIDEVFSDIWLEGPVKQLYSGQIST